MGSHLFALAAAPSEAGPWRPQSAPTLGWGSTPTPRYLEPARVVVVESVGRGQAADAPTPASFDHARAYEFDPILLTARQGRLPLRVEIGA